MAKLIDHRSRSVAATPQWQARAEFAKEFFRAGAIRPERALTVKQAMRITQAARSTVYRILDSAPGFAPIKFEDEAVLSYYLEWDLLKDFCDTDSGVYYPLDLDLAASVARKTMPAEDDKGPWKVSDAKEYSVTLAAMAQYSYDRPNASLMAKHSDLAAHDAVTLNEIIREALHQLHRRVNGFNG